MTNGCYLLPGANFIVAMDNKGLWPNLTLLDNGDILAAAYNQPSHGWGCGNVECFRSTDGGSTWETLSVISDHSEEPKLTRMNHSFGRNARGELVALVSGWSEGRSRPSLDMQVCISDDGGQTWKRRLQPWREIPHGDIVIGPNGRIACSGYTFDQEVYQAWCFTSDDHGETWRRDAPIAAGCGETSLLRLRTGRWLAVSRQSNRRLSMEEQRLRSGALELSVSQDEGETWHNRGVLTLPQQAPGQLLELHDGGILLTFTTRIAGQWGVCVRVSRDQGDTWSFPHPILTIPYPSDCGYPSSVQLSDGTIVTAYYFGPKTAEHPGVVLPNTLPWHDRYHMGIARWNMDDYINEIEKNIAQEVT